MHKRLHSLSLTLLQTTSSTSAKAKKPVAKKTASKVSLLI